LLTIALEHIEQSEAAHNTAGQIRRGLYVNLVRLAFDDQPRERLYEFLLDGFTQIDAATQPSRETLVDELFRALMELCLLARMPVVYAFDALESLLADPPDAQRCHAFFKGLGDVLDSHRGIPFFLFAEQGHWQLAQRYMTEYVKQRFAQGVIRVPRFGSVSTVLLARLSSEELTDIAAARMKPLLTDFYDGPVPDGAGTYPFQSEDLAKIARAGSEAPPLRQTLQALRDRYDEIVNGKIATINGTPGPAPPPTPPPLRPDTTVERLEALWQRELRAARRKLEQGSLAGLADELHAGVLKWFECVIAEGTATPSGRPTAAANAALGGHPTYGQITTYEWMTGQQPRKLGLGLLLGTGAGMPRDLETKLKILAVSPCPVEMLVILWPRGDQVTSPVHEQFPPGTRAVWDQFQKKGVTQHVHLQAVSREEIAPWLALLQWYKAVQTEMDGVSIDAVRHFVAEGAIALLKVIEPRS
jgi:hypothetical protein